MKLDPRKLKSERESHDWSQEALANKAGISLRAYQRAESGENVRTASKIAGALNVDLGTLLPGELTQEGSDLVAYVGNSVPPDIRETLEENARSACPTLHFLVADESCHLSLLEKCSAIVVFASGSLEESLVRELMYAIGRHMRIIVIHREGQKVRLPAFCEVDQLDTFTESQCAEAIRAIQEWHETARPIVQLQHLLTLVANGNGRWPAAYQGPLSGSRISQAYNEVRDIAARRYRVAISFETEYLQRATTVFQTASRVYATSLDGISTFWSDAAEYIQIQPSVSVRWFVLRDGDDLGRLPSQSVHTLLDQHSDQYGTSGSVLVGRRNEYEHFIEAHWPKDHVQSFLNLDFALLEHKTTKGAEWTFASLSRHEFVVQRFDESHPCFHALVKFRDIMEGIRRKNISRGTVETHPDIGRFVRWEAGFQDARRHDFISVLDNLYQRERVVTHMVFLNLEGEGHEVRMKCRKALIRAMNRIKARLPVYERSYGLIDLRYGRKVDVFESGHTDPKRPHIITEPAAKDEVCLLMTFADRSQKGSYSSATDSLRQYYNEREHVQDRFSLYGEMGNALDPIGRLHSHLVDDHEPAVAEILAECLEREVTRYVIRRDYVDDLSWKDVLDV